MRYNININYEVVWDNIMLFYYKFSSMFSDLREKKNQIFDFSNFDEKI